MGPIYGSSIYLRKIYAALRACRIVIVRKKKRKRWSHKLREDLREYFKSISVFVAESKSVQISRLITYGSF